LKEKNPPHVYMTSPCALCVSVVKVSVSL
jgi:hypothetical protein